MNKFERNQEPRKAMRIGIYSMVPDIKKFFTELRKYYNCDCEDFPWNCFFLLEDDKKIGLCYKYGDNEWYYAMFENITHIYQGSLRPRNSQRFSKDFCIFLEKEGIFEETAMKNYDFHVNLKESYRFERNVDPKRAMNIGALTWDKLKPGDVLKVKKPVLISRITYSLFPSDDDLPKATYIVNNKGEKSITSVKYFIIQYIQYLKNNEISIGCTIAPDKNSMENIRESIIKNWRHQALVTYEGTFKKEIWKSWFKIYPREQLKESYHFERGKEPKEVLEIDDMYQHNDEIHDFAKEINAMYDGRIEQFPRSCYLTNHGVCYRFGDERWYYATFDNIWNIHRLYNPPKNIRRFSKNFCIYLQQNNIIKFSEAAIKDYDEIVSREEKKI